MDLDSGVDTPANNAENPHGERAEGSRTNERTNERTTNKQTSERASERDETT